ncbi:GNAT family N-acetyltransferase [Rummeliibacillus sp. TYF005]|uniref:GNAT family N-acetyltransferase n=1 Tax=Rummeliibacillus sp. TYF005 TaxID=2058214 RepID=UPI000F535652|nr:GNAT family N-acetyltransferase [Rummeliibacillus sp. TYF005]RPJ96331.1 N-acetyltransferase [Rummeliibacillus sp. TYF005]
MIETKRIKLRDYNTDDFHFLNSLLKAPEMVRFIGNGKTKNETEAKAFYDWIKASYDQNKDYGLKIIELKDTGERIGHAGLVPQIINGEELIEIGYWISTNYWGEGFATEVAKALRDYGEKELHLQKMIALIQVDNLASQKVARNIGMKEEREIDLKGKQVKIFTI